MVITSIYEWFIVTIITILIVFISLMNVKTYKEISNSSNNAKRYVFNQDYFMIGHIILCVKSFSF